MTEPGAADALWLGLDPQDPHAEERHLEHLVLDLLQDLGLAAPLVLTHLVRTQGMPRTAASARLTGRRPSPLEEGPLLAELHRAWPGAFVLAGGQHDAVVERGSPAGRDGARAALSEGRTGAGGRAVRFPGQDALTAPLPVEDVPRVCAVADVVAVVGELAPGTVLDPCDHVRPRQVEGRLVLEVRPGPGGSVVPVEKREVHSCAGH